MNSSNRLPPNLHLHDGAPAIDDLRQHVLVGLARRPRAIPPKFFYDEQGSRLFEAICELPEYYPTRTEIGILRAYAGEMAALIGPGGLLVEFGSGSSEKVRLLLRALRPAAYLPLDISREHLWRSARALAEEYPEVMVHAVCTDYTRTWELPRVADGRRKVAFFPGSSVGNFDPDEALAFLRRVVGLVSPEGGLLIGTDLKKDRAVLDAAYNDAQGVTAAFNLNLLARINRELDADFALDGFRHHAFYNEAEGRIEMHLLSLRRQTVTVDGVSFGFAEGEGIHTESSYKYTVEEFQAIARAAGFHPARVWTDPQHLFAVHYLMAG